MYLASPGIQRSMFSSDPNKQIPVIIAFVVISGEGSSPHDYLCNNTVDTINWYVNEQSQAEV